MNKWYICFALFQKRRTSWILKLKLYIGPLILDCLEVRDNELESELFKFKKKTIQMFKFDLLVQQCLFYFLFFLVKRVQVSIYCFFSKLVKKAEKNDAETMKSLNPFVKVFILFAQSGKIISWYPTPRVHFEELIYINLNYHKFSTVFFFSFFTWLLPDK